MSYTILPTVASLGPSVRRLGGLLLLASTVLFAGCIATSPEKVAQKMSPAEKRMADTLAQVTEGMTKDEVWAILGKPWNSQKSGTWQYYVNRRGGKGDMTTVGTPTGRIEDTIAVTTQVDTAQWDAVALVYFSKDRVKKWRLMGSSGYYVPMAK